MTQRLGTAMHCIMLRAGVGLEVTVMVALHSQYSLHAKYGIEVRVFSAGLLATSPSRITEDVHIRTPECKLRIARVIYDSHRYVEDIVVRAVPVCACFVRNCREYVIDHFSIEGGCHSDRLRINCVAILSYTVTCFAPPVV